MTSKIIQVPMNEELLKNLNKVCKKQKVKRAALIRQVCQNYIKQIEDAEAERQCIEAYRKIPDDPAIGEVGAKLAAEILSKEDW